MKTPDTRTRTKLVQDLTTRSASVTPWGAAPGRLIVERPTSKGGATARAALRARLEQDHPEGKAAARRRYFGQQRALPDEAGIGDDAAKATPAPAVRRALASAAKSAAGLGAAAPVPTFSAAAKAALPAWRDLGPTLIPKGQTYGEGIGSSPSVSGRCCGVMVDRANPNHLVLCSSGGGLWGSLDQGATWAPLTDAMPTLVMGAIEQAPSAPAIAYAATGDGDGQIPYGVGLLRSSDAGLTWTLVPNASLSGLGCYDLAVHPSDALTVWIATTSALLVTRNGGGTVQAVLNAPCWSVSLHPAQPDELFAAFSSGLVRSLDGGATWSAVALPGTTAATRFRRLEVCHASGNGAVVFVAGCTDTRQPVLWRRASFGGAFTSLNTPPGIKVGQAWYDWCLAVAPDDPDLVLWGAIDLHKGRRGAAGMVWENVSSRVNRDSIHPDQHHAVFDPSHPGVVYACNDGGLYRSPDRCDHWASLNPGLGITEFEYLAQLATNDVWLFGGTQDNGSLTIAGPRHWDQVALGDGGDCAAIDRGADSIVFHSYYDMPIERALALGATAYAWERIDPPSPNGYACLFYPPLEAAGSTLVRAGSTVWISADDGDNWDEVALPTSADPDPPLASALALHGADTVFVGMTSGELWRVKRGAGGWASASVTALANLPGYVSDLALVGSTAKTVWASCSAFGAGHVLRSLNGGKTFTDRTGTLPDLPVNALVVDPKNSSRVFAATDRGVWQTKNSGAGWSAFSNGMPNVIVGDLLLHVPTRRLRAGTRSRGAWELSL